MIISVLKMCFVCQNIFSSHFRLISINIFSKTFVFSLNTRKICSHSKFFNKLNSLTLDIVQNHFSNLLDERHKVRPRRISIFRPCVSFLTFSVKNKTHDLNQHNFVLYTLLVKKKMSKQELSSCVSLCIMYNCAQRYGWKSVATTALEPNDLC